MTHYFLKDGKKEVGPFSIDQLKYRNISKETPVWFAGLEEWTTAEKVYELKPIFTSQSSTRKFPNTRLARFWNSLLGKTPPGRNYHVAMSKERDQLN